MKKTSSEKLLREAFKFPQANRTHFRDPKEFPSGVDAKLIRISMNSGIRTRLINAGLAQGIQSPIGREVIKSILHIYPNGDAPEIPKKTQAQALPTKKFVPVKLESMRNSRKPTLDDLKAMITRIEAIEGHLARELSMTLEGEILDLKVRIGNSDIEQLPELADKLKEALDKKNNARLHIRADAFRQVQLDKQFPQREFISLIAT